MSERIEVTSTEDRIEPKAERASWQRPEMFRVGLHGAEADTNTNSDLAVFT